METVGKILFTEEQIRNRARELGKQIAEDFKGEPIYLVGTLRGAVMWMSDMMKEIPNEMEIDFVVASSYGSSTTTSGSVTIKKDLESNIYGKNVIIVEDIIDTGTTLNYLKNEYLKRGPKCVKICSMLDKPSRRVIDIEGDYVGFKIDNLFVIGYGLDYDQKYRNLPYISYLEG